MRGGIKRLLEELFVDRYNCIVCGDEMRALDRHGVCPTCMANMPVNTGENICRLCGKAMRDEAEYCLTCQNNTFFFDINRSYFVYRDDAKRLVHALKFGGKKYLAKYMAEFYVDTYERYGYDADVIVSVPISRKRRKERGYDQSREVALVLSERLGLPYVEDAVVKTKELVPQEKLSGRERLSSVIGAFRLNRVDDIKGKKVLLIDDVLTTGATMSAVAMELSKKCTRVEGITFASPEVTYGESTGDVHVDYEMELTKY